MKKTYIKPMLSKESFSMTENVATGCGYMDGVLTNSNNPESCYFAFENDPEDKMFSVPSVCVNTNVDEESYCYHGMTGGMPIFRS